MPESRRVLLVLITLLTAVLAVLVTGPAAGAAGSSVGASPQASRSAKLSTLIDDLPLDQTAHSGYDRALFKTWIDADHDGCDTREEVLLDEATKAPTKGSGCTLTGGQWYSYYDEATWNDKSDVDIDHLVPLGEVWTSGGYGWTSTRREDYANDLGDSRTLIAVTDNVNQSKGDRDPAHWMPPAASATCTYIDQWVAVKTRWGLTADNTEISALKHYASGCPDVTITVTTT